MRDGWFLSDGLDRVQCLKPALTAPAALARHFAYYNFCRVHRSLRVTPAMEAGITDHVWSVENIARLA